MQSIWRICVVTVFAASATASATHLYEVTVETGMPHLEENLRYTTTRSQQCLARDDLDSAFPILDHPSLAGCKLREQQHDEDVLLYILICERSPETTGTARWQLGERLIRGTLDVKLGGKNMTLYQRVTGALIGECPTAPTE